MDFAKIVNDATPPKAEPTIRISFDCPKSLNDTFTAHVRDLRADRTKMLVAAVEGLVAAMKGIDD